ncbi:MAG: coenzyme F420-0:L-glutamate ligase [Candidatus Magasanikbacteria bacterium]|nr:coenzyme F420-0:L-glutamate ligase [Candidatus Magasanikbacteria bacterium]
MVSSSIEAQGIVYERFPIRTHVVGPDDRISDIVERYAVQNLSPGDVLFISERVVAITQGRAIPIKDIKPGFWARFLTHFVHKSKYGIGLGIPETMHLAIKEVGLARILLGALVAALTKPLGIKGMFYHIAGRQAAAIDGPCSYTLPPYNQYATLAPKNPNSVAADLKARFGHDVVIIDANDIGVDVLGRSSKKIDKAWARAVFRDNPLGQTNEQTPLCVVRKNSL